MASTTLGRSIVIDPEICHGKPTFRGTRIFVEDVLEQVSMGMVWEAIIEELRGKINKDAIAESVRFAREAFSSHAAEILVYE